MTLIKNEKRSPVLNYVGVFLLGILVAVNLFFGWSAFYLRKEIEKLKSDDLTLAQAINTISQQLNQITGGKVTGPTISTGGEQPADNGANTNTNTNAPAAPADNGNQ